MQNFPWFPKPVNILTPRLATKLQKKPAIVLFIGKKYVLKLKKDNKKFEEKISYRMIN